MNKDSNVDFELYNKAYFEQTDGANYFFKGEVAPKFLKAVKAGALSEGQQVLDVGCGRGDLTI